MKRASLIVTVISFVLVLSGCIVTKSPNATDVTTTRGTTTTFSITVFPFGGTYAWTLDGTTLANTASSLQYTPTGGTHTLTVTATHILGTDTQTWSILDAEAKASVGAAGATVAVTDTDSPLVGAAVEISAGALDTTVTVTISQTETPSGLALQATGPCVEFGPTGTQFTTPVTLALPYYDTDNDGVVDGTSVAEDMVKAYYYNESTSAWEEVDIIDSDADANVVYISVTHFSEYITAVSSSITWQRMYGGSGLDITLSGGQPTSDGGYVFAGYTGSTDIIGITTIGMLVVKLDVMGNVVWQQTYGDGYYITSIRQTSDGGYIMTYGYIEDISLMKLDAEGNVLWQKTYDSGWSDLPFSVQQTSDGGYIVSGIWHSSSGGIWLQGEAMVMKLDTAGDIVWQQIYGENSEIHDVKQTSSGGYIITLGWGGDYGGGYSDYHIINVDAEGNVLWERIYGGSFVDFPSSIEQTSDGGYIVSGVSYSTDIPGIDTYGGNLYIIRLDANGDLIWQKMCGGSSVTGGSFGTFGFSDIRQTSDGGFIATIASASTDISGVTNNGDDDYYIIRLNADGDILWQKMYGGSGSDIPYSIDQTPDGGYVVIGTSDSTDITGVTNSGGTSDIYIIKLNSDGDL